MPKINPILVLAPSVKLITRPAIKRSKPIAITKEKPKALSKDFADFALAGSLALMIKTSVSGMECGYVV